MRLLLGITSILLLGFAVNAQWVRQRVDTTASFRGLAVVNEKIIWASGTGGTVIRTIDGGKTWNVITVPGAEKLDLVCHMGATLPEKLAAQGSVSG